MKCSHVALKSNQLPPRLMLFDLALGGHHGNYIQHVVDYAHKTAFTGEIDIVVLPNFFEVHRETVGTISKYARPAIHLVPISADDEASLGSCHSSVSRALRNLREWQIFCKYAKELRSTQALIMYFDTCELPLTLGIQSPCSFSGIYFRPTFHYHTFTNCSLSFKERIQQWREKITLGKILRHPQLQTVFCLDPFAVKAISSHPTAAKVVHLADPVQPFPLASLNIEDLRTKLGIELRRKVLLLFGALDGRKGIYQLLDAIGLLPVELCQNLCLLLVGKTNEIEQANIKQKIAVLCQTHPIQIVECYDFIPESEVSSYFQAADIVLAPYQRHVGMSGILLLAAATGKPVISSNYGLMGELVRRYKLGLTVDSTLATEIAKGLMRALLESPETLSDRTQMSVFAKQNSVELYASTIFQHLNLDNQGVLPKSVE